MSHPAQSVDFHLWETVTHTNDNVNLTATYNLLRRYPAALARSETVEESHTLRVTHSTMELFDGNLSLGHYYLWLPSPVLNGTRVPDYLTVVDIYNRTYELAGRVIEKSGFDYIVVQNDDPYLFLTNVYNASTGVAVSLMIPGRTAFSVSQIESGNFTQGKTNIAYTPLGNLLNLNWFDFYMFQGQLVALSYVTDFSEFADLEIGSILPLQSSSTSTSSTASLSSPPTAPGPDEYWALAVSAIVVFGLLIVSRKLRQRKKSGRS